MEIEAKMAEDKARAEEDAAKAKIAAETPLGTKPAVVRRLPVQGVVKRPQTPVVRKRGF